MFKLLVRFDGALLLKLCGKGYGDDGDQYGNDHQHDGNFEVHALSVGNNSVQRARSANRMDPLSPSADGRVLFDAQRRLGPDLAPYAGEPQLLGRLHPAEDGVLVFTRKAMGAARFTARYHAEAIQPEQLTFFVTGDDVPLWTLPDLDFGPESRNSNALPQSFPEDRRLLYLPAAKRLVAVAKSGTQLFIWAFDIEQQLRAAGKPYLWIGSRPPATVAPGEKLSYTVQVVTDAKSFTATLVSGPPQMTVSPGGLVQWSVPEDERAAPPRVVLSIRTPDDRETLHTFSIRIEDKPKPPAP